MRHATERRRRRRGAVPISGRNATKNAPVRSRRAAVTKNAVRILNSGAGSGRGSG
jgi:hypothetical protein